MAKSIFLVLAAWLTISTLGWAQPQTGPDRGTPVDSQAALQEQTPPFQEAFHEFEYFSRAKRGVWLQADYLLWWIQRGPMAAPLVTTGADNGSGITPGTLGQPSTSVLFGDRDLDFGHFSGLRIRTGMWLDRDDTLGIEFSYFGLERRSVLFAASSDDIGHPVLARPFVNGTTGSPTALLSSFPGELAGGVRVEATTRLWGWEINGVSRPNPDSPFRWVAGFRALDLSESLQITEPFTPLSPTPIFQGQTFGPPARLTTFDGFRTTNHFYGPQLGGKLFRSFGPWTVEASGTLALGWTNQRVRIEGDTTLVATPGAQTQAAPGGVLAQTSNIGDYHRTRFGAVPEVGINLSRKITENLRVQIGYTFLYWNNVARPGAQIDPVVSDVLIPTSPFFGVGTAPNRPAFQFQSNAFWAQGITFGLMVDF